MRNFILLSIIIVYSCNNDLSKKDIVKMQETAAITHKDSLDDFVYSCTRPQPYFSQLMRPLIDENDSAWRVLQNNFKAAYSDKTLSVFRVLTSKTSGDKEL